MDYLSFFNLSTEPFSHAPLPRFYYASEQHTAALQRLMHAAESMKGLALLLGDIGHGKTTLARRMLDMLPEDQYEAALLVMVHAGITANWLLKRIAMQLGVPEPADDKLAILSQLYERLVAIRDSGRRAVVLIDEAQMLQTQELMEEFRGLLNIEVPGAKLISFIFFGLPELENNLALDPPLAQRVAIRCRLKPLGREDTEAYVTHRLRLADAEDEIFSPEAIGEVHQWSKGVPRVINTLCDNVLLEAFFAQEQRVTPELVAEVAENLGLLEEIRPPENLARIDDAPAVDGSRGHDAMMPIVREPSEPGAVSADAIAARIATEGATEEAPVVPPPLPPTSVATSGRVEDRGPPAEPVVAEAGPDTVDVEDPLAFLGDTRGQGLPTYEPEVLEAAPVEPVPPAAGIRFEEVSAPAPSLPYDDAPGFTPDPNGGVEVTIEMPADFEPEPEIEVLGDDEALDDDEEEISIPDYDELIEEEPADADEGILEAKARKVAGRYSDLRVVPDDPDTITGSHQKEARLRRRREQREEQERAAEQARADELARAGAETVAEATAPLEARPPAQPEVRVEVPAEGAGMEHPSVEAIVDEVVLEDEVSLEDEVVGVGPFADSAEEVALEVVADDATEHVDIDAVSDAVVIDDSGGTPAAFKEPTPWAGPPSYIEDPEPEFEMVGSEAPQPMDAEITEPLGPRPTVTPAAPVPQFMEAEATVPMDVPPTMDTLPEPEPEPEPVVAPQAAYHAEEPPAVEAVAAPEPESEPVAAPEPQSTPPADSASKRSITTSAGRKIDLQEIDDLLAEVSKL